ncbi:acyl-CoA dehydrogenase family protein [Nannocystis sp.]|uniref:acyl-CoA dehydrogenase family protein n=1 Tax=Nannocystis sp. TaxID=1962667 RepID=UPI0025CBE885|nr:acyl-CoA dehydrogenase family protein [Nannocystis sp.]MBK7825522.1 acyl-CoA dehydrogenase family protein [Nannocystis sp.]
MIDAPLVARAEAAAQLIRPHAEAIERQRRLPAEAVAALVDAGIFKLLVPQRFGGAETSVATLAAVLEAIARADGSAGWCAMIGATSGLMSAFLPEATAREVFSPPDVITGGVFAPLGRATREQAGYRVRGRWPFCSGCQHAGWLMGGVLVDTGDPARPELRSLLFQRDELEIHDTWDTSGLRGTGSHDISVDELVVAHARSFSLLAAPTIDAPLYRQPFFGTLAAGVAAVSLGIARNALDALLALAAHKQPGGARKTIAHRELVQLHVARGEAELLAARAGLHAAITLAADEVSALGHAGLRTRALLRAAACHAASASASVVDHAYEAGGATSIYSGSPLQRCFRDVHVATQHIMVGPTSAILAGRVLLGVDGDTSSL